MSKLCLASHFYIKYNAQDIGLIGGPEKRDIKIFDCDPSWPQKFKTHKEKIAGALGEKALRIEHIGSTSVPGLAAKPIIDILLVVANSGDEASYLPQLKKVGYELRVREPDFYEHRMLRTPERDVQIHVFSLGSPEIEHYITFRDRLRSNESDRKRYEEIKRQLTAQSWSDMNAYVNAKTEVIEKILSEARRTGGISQ